MSSRHKKPILAFVVLAVIAILVVSGQLHANAQQAPISTSGVLAPVAAGTVTSAEAAPVPSSVAPRP